MKLINLKELELQELKVSLLDFVKRVSQGRCSSIGEVQMLPEVVKLLCGYPSYLANVTDFTGEISDLSEADEEA